MGLAADIKQILRSLVQTGNVAYDVLPDGAIPKTLASDTGAWDYGAWAEIAASVGVADVWLVGLGFQNSSAAVDFDVDIGIGAGGSESAIGTFPIIAAVFFLPYPIKIAAGTRLAGRCRSSTAIADTIDVKCIVATGL